MFYGYGYYMDWTYSLVLLGVIITMVASAQVKAAFARYSNVRCSAGITGRDAAERILNANGIYNVSIEPIHGQFTDHYDPSKKVLRLSETVYSMTSVAAVSVAAHECGHAIQDKVGYAPLNFRSMLVPIANIGAKISWPMILIGLLIANAGNWFGEDIMAIGILCFSLAVLFQLVTLPVEFNASRRAMVQLKDLGILDSSEYGSAKSVLTAAALTYVAAAAASLLQLLRLIILFGGNRRRK